MAYKVLKADYGAKNVANYVCIHGTKFESFTAIISWLVLDRIRGVKCWWGAGPQTFDLVLYINPYCHTQEFSTTISTSKSEHPHEPPKKTTFRHNHLRSDSAEKKDTALAPERGVINFAEGGSARKFVSQISLISDEDTYGQRQSTDYDFALVTFL